MSNIDWEKVSMEMIVKAGSAKSNAMEALYLAKDGKFKEAESKMIIANQESGEASHSHMGVLVEEAKGTKLEFKLLFMHAEDQMLTTQAIILMVQEMIDLWKEVKKNSAH